MKGILKGLRVVEGSAFVAMPLGGMTLAQLGATGIRIVDSLVEGIPLGVVVGGVADGTPVFTKAGGFGAEDALVLCVERMRL